MGIGDRDIDIRFPLPTLLYTGYIVQREPNVKKLRSPFSSYLSNKFQLYNINMRFSCRRYTRLSVTSVEGSISTRDQLLFLNIVISGTKVRSPATQHAIHKKKTVQSREPGVLTLGSPCLPSCVKLI